MLGIQYNITIPKYIITLVKAKLVADGVVDNSQIKNFSNSDINRILKSIKETLTNTFVDSNIKNNKYIYDVAQTILNMCSNYLKTYIIMLKGGYKESEICESMYISLPGSFHELVESEVVANMQTLPNMELNKSDIDVMYNSISNVINGVFNSIYDTKTECINLANTVFLEFCKLHLYFYISQINNSYTKGGLYYTDDLIMKEVHSFENKSKRFNKDIAIKYLLTLLIGFAIGIIIKINL